MEPPPAATSSPALGSRPIGSRPHLDLYAGVRTEATMDDDAHQVGALDTTTTSL